MFIACAIIIGSAYIVSYIILQQIRLLLFLSRTLTSLALPASEINTRRVSCEKKQRDFIENMYSPGSFEGISYSQYYYSISNKYTHERAMVRLCLFFIYPDHTVFSTTNCSTYPSPFIRVSQESYFERK